MIMEGLFAIALAASQPKIIEPVAVQYYYRKRVKRKPSSSKQKATTFENNGPTTIAPIRCYTEACPSFDDMWSYLPIQWQRTR